jgi:multidrug efflux pump subunit AcrA (membrane-fusion protein)
VAERQLAGIKVGGIAEVRLVTGERANGKIRFVAKTASPTTRTYRVEIEVPNADGNIPDGITAEVLLPLAPVVTEEDEKVRATRYPVLILQERIDAGADRGVLDDENVPLLQVALRRG